MKKKLVDFWTQKQGTILQLLLGGTILLFISIMIGVYLIAKRANPILLDEKGRPKYAQNGS